MSWDLRTVRTSFVVAAILALSAGLAPANASPETFVRSLSKQILFAANTRDTARFRSLLRRHADIKAIANFALGRYRSRIPPAQRKRYYRLVEDDMVRFFRDYSKSLKGSSVTVNRVSRRGKLFHIDTRINGSGAVVLWRLSRGRGYKVRDVQVLGVWLGHLMRMAYTGEIRRGGYKRLFAYLQN